MDVIRGNLDSDNYQHLYHLFCHEVGHGLQMDHDEDQGSIMYKSIPDNYALSLSMITFSMRLDCSLKIKIRT